MQQSPSSLWITGEQNGFPRPFGNYLLLAAFAQGGMGELFLAMNGSIAGSFRLCVVKKLRPDLTNDKEYVNRFIDEARVVVQLNHANISHVFDIGRIEGQYYLAMEYVSGISVKRLMSRAEELETAIPEDIAVFIARETLAALDYAHEHSHPISGEALHVVHRDVSPQNILVSWSGEVKLIDFGLALSAMKDEHTATGAVMGKVAYMPPEQARGEDVGPSCDQFATAIVAYEMLAGDRYHGDLPLHAIWAIAGMGNFPPPKWSKLPRELQIILQRALLNDPYKRYDTCGDLREGLGAYMAAHHPATSGRNLRDLLEKWFKEYRAEERELLAQFKDVTGSKIREVVKAAGATTESLVSGPHIRQVGWQMPPTEPDGRAVSGNAPVSPALLAAQPTPLLGDRLDESRSMRLMPPPALGGAVADALANAAAALLTPTVPPGPSILAPPMALPTLALEPLQLAAQVTAERSAGAQTASSNLSTVGESTERYMLRGAGPSAVDALTPRATVAESTARFQREQAPGADAVLPLLEPISLAAPASSAPVGTAPAPAAPTAPAPTAPAVTAALSGALSGAPAPAPAASPPRPMSQVARHEPTERVRLRASDEDEDLEFDPGRRRLWPWAAAAASAVAGVVVLIAVSSSTDPETSPIGGATTPIVATTSSIATPIVPPTTTTPTTTTPVAAIDPEPTPTPVVATPTTPVATPVVATPTATRLVGKTPRGRNPVVTTPATTTPATTPATTVAATPPVEGENREAIRARDRVETLRRSGCSDPCVGRIVGQLETMPGAVELDGFRTSVASCIDACRAR